MTTLLQGRMGLIEVQDQVLGVKTACEIVDFIDVNRIAITGWSYGGYLSLMAVIQYPSVFKVTLIVNLVGMHDTGLSRLGMYFWSTSNRLAGL